MGMLSNKDLVNALIVNLKIGTGQSSLSFQLIRILGTLLSRNMSL